jgi:hypothetical protein
VTKLKLDPSNVPEDVYRRLVRLLVQKSAEGKILDKNFKKKKIAQ